MARFSLKRRGGKGGSGTRAVDLRFDALDDALEAMLAAGAEIGDQIRPVVAEILVAEVLEVFAREGAVAGNPAWPRFWWERDGLPRPKGRRWQGELKLLQDRGVLAGSITPYSQQPFAEAFSNVPYAGYHVSQRARRKIPLRDFTQIDFEKAMKETCDLILAQLDANSRRVA